MTDSLELEKQQCKEAADIVVDALIDAGLLQEKDSDKATEIIEEELLVSKSLRKL